MAVTSADVPGKYDVVFRSVTGVSDFGCVFADSVDPSLPFRTHRAIYDLTPTFVERQNVTNTYGDQSQDFFLTASQKDWSEGEDQRFFHLSDQDSQRRYWRGNNIDITVPGQATIRPATSAITFAAAVSGAVADTTRIFTSSSTNLYEVGNTGGITDRGVHGAGGLADVLANDGIYVYLAGSATSAVRRYDTGAHTYTSFSTTTASSLTFNNNTMYGTGSGVFNLYNTSGTATGIFTFQDAIGDHLGGTKRIARYGGQIAILAGSAQGANASAQLFIGDSAGVSVVAEFPSSFQEYNLLVAYGIIFVIGVEFNSSLGVRTVIYYYANGTIGRLYASEGWYPSGSPFSNLSMAAYQGGIVFPDLASSSLRFYDVANGGISTIAAYTPTNTATYMASSEFALLVTQGTTTGTFFGTTNNVASSGSVASSLIDFDSSLPKVFRGIAVDYIPATDGNGGSVDIAYQVDSLDGSYTNLQTGATSGTEYTLSNVSGHAISVKITLNKGTSTAGPILKRVYVRAAPQLRQFRSGTYILDCTGTAEQPRELRDNSYHPLTGYEQVQSLLAAAKASTPFTVTDKVNGTFTALVDLSDSEGWDVYEVHPDAGNKEKPGAYLVRVKVREV